MTIAAIPDRRGICLRQRLFRMSLRLMATLLAMLCTTTVATANDAPGFSTEIRPLLSRYCFACHGPDPAARQADLRLDIRAGLFAESSDGGPIVEPGNPQASALFRRVTSADTELRMPPAATQHQLNSAQISLLREWISDGARFDEHWSFVAPAVSEPPSLTDPWIRNSIDQFVLQRLQQEGLRPSAEADRVTLIRRLSLDLTGLPPTPQLLQEFGGDDVEHTEDSYQRLVDRLLLSEHYGEQWARHWLDLAHYADSDGYLGDAMRPYAWLYRDWVIASINADQPFDQFTVEQLAGDLLPEATLQQQVATGFLRNTLTNTEAGVDLEEYRLKEITDRVSTLGTGWLGLSLGCAECHSHKYDPVSQHEFYQLFSFFNDADDVDVPAASEAEQERWQAAEAEWKQRLQELRESVLAVLKNADGDATDAQAEAVVSALLTEEKKRSSEQKAEIAAVRERISEEASGQLTLLEKHGTQRPKPPATMARTVAARKSSRETWVHVRGNYRQRGDTVGKGTPAFLPALQSRGPDADRLDLARWLVSEENPLTARVVANRWWSHLFGRGLVQTIDNFGSGGASPSHPALLDWLALELQRKHWSRREFLRMIVTSATYRQSSAMRPELLTRDPQNQLLARQGRFRLNAEQIRDAALTASGLLHRKVGGPSIRPPQPDYVAAISRNVTWEVTKGPDLYRRGLYVMLRRATPYPMLQTFDAPDSTVACVQRERTNSPLQALTLLNDPVFVECAEQLGRELQQQSAMSRRDRIRLAFQRCLGRDAGAAELERLELFLRAQGDGEDLSEATGEAAWTALARVLLNLDEFMTRE